MENSTLAHYEIRKKLGEGGMGEVYLAHDTKLGRDVALKILPKKLAADPERRKRFEREARAIAALKHPNIVTLHSVEEADGYLFITMEHVEGGTLADELEEDGLPLKKFFDLAIPVADALATAHGKGIAHRDIKPANIMRDAAGNVKILDFGLAKLFETQLDDAHTIAGADESVTAEGRILGTVAYMSPEQAEGGPIDARSDVFSLGVVLYEMATGKRPFQGKTNISTISAILKENPPSVDDLRPVVPRHLGRIIQRCLAKAPDRRYQSALDVRNELEGLKQETSSGMTSQSNLRDAATVARSRGAGVPKWIPWAAGLAVVAVIAVFMLQRGGDPDRSVTEQGSKPAATAAVAEQAERQRIVVFPFENLGEPDDAYFAAGITEEITSRLARVTGLSVMSRSSASQYDRAGKSMKQIGEELEVDYVLEGSVRWEKRGDGTSRVRVTPQLIRTDDDSHVWAQNYDRAMEEVFSVQSEIAEQVVGKLNVALLPEEAEAMEEKLTDNLMAWHAYQRARVTRETADADAPETHLLAEKMMTQAVELDPNFTRAWAELAVIHAGFAHSEVDRSQERLAKSKAAVDRAFELEPESPWGYFALGMYYYHGSKNYEPAWEALQKALAGMGENSRVYDALASVRRRQGRFQDALDYFTKGSDLQPRDVYGHINTAETAGYVLGKYDEALEHFEQAISLQPNLRISYFYMASIQIFSGDATGGAETMESCLLPPITNSDHFSDFQIRYWTRNLDGAMESAQALTSELIDSQFDLWCRPLLIGLVHRAKGEQQLAAAEFAKAVALLETRVQEKPDEARTRSALGLAYAGAGRADDAVREGKYAVKIYPRSVDAYIAPARVRDLILIHAMLGQDDEALDLMEQIIDVPPVFALPSGLLRTHPGFDGLRDNPRCQAILRSNS